MHRLKDYANFVVWSWGVSYLALWSVTLWALDHGAAVFGASGVCRPDVAKVLFYWVCEPASPFAFLASIVNGALTVTVWAPVYVAAATVRPDALALAVPIVAVHLIGLPLALFVTIRAALGLFRLLRALVRRHPREGGLRGLLTVAQFSQQLTSANQLTRLALRQWRDWRRSRYQQREKQRFNRSCGTNGQVASFVAACSLGTCCTGACP